MSPKASLTIDESASRIVKVLFSLSQKDAGHFYSVAPLGMPSKLILSMTEQLTLTDIVFQLHRLDC